MRSQSYITHLPLEMIVEKLSGHYLVKKNKTGQNVTASKLEHAQRAKLRKCDENVLLPPDGFYLSLSFPKLIFLFSSRIFSFARHLQGFISMGKHLR